MKKVTRNQIASYLNVTPNSDTESWEIIGVGITDFGQALNPQVETEKWIIDKSARSTLESYQVQADASQKCYHGDPVYDFINNLRRTRAIGDSVVTEILDIDLYDSTGEETALKYKATKNECMVAVTSYGTGETPVIEYSIYYNGDPQVGTVSIANKKPVFTVDAEQ